MAPTHIGLRCDDERVEVDWQLTREHEVPRLWESDRAEDDHELLARPECFQEVLHSRPDVVVLSARLGQGGQAGTARLNAAYGTVHTESTLRLGGPAMGDLNPDELMTLVRLIGADPIMSGTNYAATLRPLPLTDDEPPGRTRRRRGGLGCTVT
ncbi:MAG: hypothetical protein JWO49_2919 [Arthrobacter sp.]|nr:hypothetical protein [Arthrobacter sp.]